MELDLVFIMTYECPHCHVTLEDRSSGIPAWQRCPQCGRACLPPDHQRWNRSERKLVEPTKPLLGTFTIGPEDLPIRPRMMAPMPPSAASRAPNTRLFLGIGFFASLFFCIFSSLESNYLLATLTGVAALFFLSTLVIPTGRPRSE